MEIISYRLQIIIYVSTINEFSMRMYYGLEMKEFML